MIIRPSAGTRWLSAWIAVLLLSSAAWGDPGVDRTKVPGLSSFDDPNAWSPAGGPDGNDRLLWNPLGPGFAYDELYIGPGADSNVRVAAGLTVSGNVYNYYYLYAQNGAALSLLDNGSPDSGILRFQSGNISVMEGELRAVSGFFGEGPGPTVVTVKAPARLTFSGDVNVLCQDNPQVYVYGTLSAANIHVGSLSSPAWTTLNPMNGGLLYAPDTLDVYPYANVQPIDGNIVVGTLHVYKEPGYYGNGPMGRVEGRGAIHATTVNNEGEIIGESGVLDIYGDIVQYSGGTLTAGAWRALYGGTLNLHSIGDVTAIANGAAAEITGAGSSFPKIANLNDNGGDFRVANGVSFTTAGNFANGGSILVSATDAAYSSSLVVTGDLDNYGMVAVYGKSTPGAPNSTLVVKGNVVQLDGNTNTLTGGAWTLMDNASVVFEKGGAIAVNQGYINLSGAYTRFDAINALADNRGSLSLFRREFNTVAALRNSGSLTVHACRMTVNGDYTQTGGSVQFVGWHDSAAGTDFMGQLEVHGDVFARGSLYVQLPYGSDCTTPFPLITFTGNAPDIQFSNIAVMYLHANRQWQLYQDVHSFGIEFLQKPDVHFDANWQQGMTVNDALQGWAVAFDASTGHVDLISDSLVPDHQVLQLQDLGTGEQGVHDVSLTRPLHIDDKYLHVRFDYRFLTDGKLKISLDANVLDVVFSPFDDPESQDAGRDTYATYDHWFNLTAVGFPQGATKDLMFQLLSRDGLDPEFRFDGLTIDTSGTPEPTVLTVLAVGGLLAARRRRAPRLSRRPYRSKGGPDRGLAKRSKHRAACKHA